MAFLTVHVQAVIWVLGAPGSSTIPAAHCTPWLAAVWKMNACFGGFLIMQVKSGSTLLGSFVHGHRTARRYSTIATTFAYNKYYLLAFAFTTKTSIDLIHPGAAIELKG